MGVVVTVYYEPLRHHMRVCCVQGKLVLRNGNAIRMLVFQSTTGSSVSRVCVWGRGSERARSHQKAPAMFDSYNGL